MIPFAASDAARKIGPATKVQHESCRSRKETFKGQANYLKLKEIH